MDVAPDQQNPLPAVAPAPQPQGTPPPAAPPAQAKPPPTTPFSDGILNTITPIEKDLYGHIAHTFSIQDHTVRISNQDTLPNALWHMFSVHCPIDLPITQANFCRVWKTIILKRIQDVYELEKSRRADHFIRISRNVNLPAPLADLLYTLGQYYDPQEDIMHHLVPPAHPAQPEPWRSVDADILTQWNETITLLTPYFIMKEYPPMSIYQGTPIMFTTVVDTGNLRAVKARFNGPTPSDAYIRLVNDELFEQPYATAACHFTLVSPQRRSETIDLYLEKYFKP